ncbi:MAG: hypothetical protein KGL40_04455 [Rhodocyclaceae bacterium]|nr:hypothetical protein [Rhodocyclaceae bacterium]
MSHPSVRIPIDTGRRKQRGVVLMVTLISLVILLLAATALFRSVDTATLIAGNLSLKQSALAASDRGVVNAITVLAAKQVPGTTVWLNDPHPLNNTDIAAAYYSSMDQPAGMRLMDDNINNTVWQNGVSSAESTADRAGNTSRYIIQRMCKTANVSPTPNDCILNAISNNDSSMASGGQKAKKASANVMYRITVRVTGPKNTVSYSQAFVN